MSGEEPENGGLIRSVTAPYRSRADSEMNTIGMLYGLGLVIVLLPLLPLLLVLWVFSKLADLLGPTE